MMTTFIFIATRIDGVCRAAFLVLAAVVAFAGAASGQTAAYQLKEGQQFGKVRPAGADLAEGFAISFCCRHIARPSEAIHIGGSRSRPADGTYFVRLQEDQSHCK